MLENIQFKYRYVENGNVKGFFTSKKGCVEQTALILDGHSLAYQHVHDTTSRDNRLVLAVDGSGLPGPLLNEMHDGFIVLEVYKPGAEKLEKAIDRYASAHEAMANQKRLEAEGRGHEFRTQQCPSCQATVDLSELESGRFVYCRFCDSIFGQALESLSAKNSYRECDECGMFDRVQGHTEFYFYFLLVIYGFSHRRRHLCDSCASSLFWKVLMWNLPFVLGVPPAIYLKVKASTGKDADLADLARANEFARKARVQEAKELYQRLLGRFPDHPGLLMNVGLAHFFAEQAEPGVEGLLASVKACPNYLPALRHLRRFHAAVTGPAE
ncbi:MAG: hypothetical protein AB7S38_05960 [Vulcanimicrobiota bacterium]